MNKNLYRNVCGMLPVVDWDYNNEAVRGERLCKKSILFWLCNNFAVTILIINYIVVICKIERFFQVLHNYHKTYRLIS